MRIWPWRRALQVSVFSMMFVFPLIARYAYYVNARQIDKAVESWKGYTQGRLLAVTDVFMSIGLTREEGGVVGRRPRKAILARTANFLGSAWSSKIAGVSLVDMLAAAESMLASRSLEMVLLIGLSLPLLATLLLGRVYCGWVCPMGVINWFAARLRALIVFLELKPIAIPFWRGNRFIVLAAGLLFTLVAGLPLLGYVYPPAVLSREANGFIMSLFDRAENVRPGWMMPRLTGAIFFIAALIGVQALLSPEAWCRSFCPGGALYSLLGRMRILRIKRIAKDCVECDICDQACPMALAPMSDKTGSQCDSCGVCVDVCPTGALKFKIAIDDKPILEGVR
ncbi:MAG: 4Fe-4S binding protein [Elusimicrobiota bacterium]